MFSQFFMISVGLFLIYNGFTEGNILYGLLGLTTATISAFTLYELKSGKDFCDDE